MEHIPVLLTESINGLKVKPDGIYVDGTLGRGGHSLEILKKLKTGRLIAIDCDKEAIIQTTDNLSKYKDKLTCIHGNFRDTKAILRKLRVKEIDGAIFDLGVSSPQLDNETRGFSYKSDAKLDMRMDKSKSTTAYELINTYNENELYRIFREYGEEKYSRLIARQIVRKRNISPVNTTFELNEIIISAIPAAARREKQHPSKRCFQALRIAVGDELGALNEMLDTVPLLLKKGGRICIISFHSLEDRLAKKSFANYATDCDCDKNSPACICRKKPELKIITKKPLTVGEAEAEHNPRARSAKLRIAERI